MADGERSPLLPPEAGPGPGGAAAAGERGRSRAGWAGFTRGAGPGRGAKAGGAWLSALKGGRG